MAIAYIGGVSAVGTGLNTQTVDISAVDWNPGDLAVAMLGAIDDVSPHTADAGWTQLGYAATGLTPDWSHSLWAKQLLAGEDETPSFGSPTNSYLVLGIWREVDIALACSAAVVTNVAGVSNPTAPAITATGSGGLLIIGCFSRNNATIPVPPAGSTARLSVAGSAHSFALADKSVGAGAQAPGNWAHASDRFGVFSVVFAPEVTALTLTGVRATMNKIGESI